MKIRTAAHSEQRRANSCQLFAARCALLAAVALAFPFAQAHAERKPWDRRPGVVLYELKPEATARQRSALAGALGMHSASAAPSAAVPRSYRMSALVPAGQDEEDLAKKLMQSGAIVFAEPDYRMPAAALPNDPGLATQWHHAAVHSQSAWDVTTGDSSVLVAVCDTGVDAAHADLAANLSLPGYNTADGTTNTTAVADHGTAVAGIIGAAGNNGLGVTGMAWNIKILPVRVTNLADASAWCSDMASGIEWAADHGAKVINLSYDITGCPNTINAAAQYALGKGALTFIAAGNSGTNLSGSFPQTHAFILVGATNELSQRASFSNFGPPVDLVAPGVSIYAPRPGNAYAPGNGTSFAAPLSAGVAALIYAISASWTPAQVRTFILATTQAAGALNGYGQLDASAAVHSAQSVLAGGPMPQLPGTPGSGQAAAAANLDSVLVFPNPWRADRHAGIPVVFDSLTADSTVKIFTFSGFLVRTLTPALGQAGWDLKTESGDAAASGIYLYSITDGQGHQSQGKLAVLR